MAEIEPIQTVNLDQVPSMPKDSPVDSSAQPDPEITQGAGDPRKDAMAAIVAARAQVLNREVDLSHQLGFQPGAADQTPASVTPSPDVTPKPAEPARPDVTPQAPVQPISQTPERVKVTLSGQALDLTPEEILSLADDGLKARQFIRTAPRVQQPPTVQAPAAPVQPQPTAVEIVDPALAKEYAKKLNYGSEEDQAQALVEYGKTIAQRVMSSLPQGPNAEQIAAQAAQHAVQQIHFQNNLQTIGSEFPEIYQDRNLSLIAAREVGEIRHRNNALGTPKDDLTVWREACSLVKSRYIPTHSAPPPQDVQTTQTAPQAAPVVSMTERLERKRAAPRQPTAAHAAAPSAPVQGVKSPSEIVKWMAQKRGQQVAS